MNKKTELTTVVQKIDEVRAMLEKHIENPQMIPHIESALVMDKLQFAYDVYFKIANKAILNPDFKLGESSHDSTQKKGEEIIKDQPENIAEDLEVDSDEPDIPISEEVELTIEAQIKSDGEDFKPIETDDLNEDLPESELLDFSKENEIELFPNEPEKAEMNEGEEDISEKGDEYMHKAKESELEKITLPEETIDLFSKTLESESKTVADEISEKVQEESIADKFQKNKISDLKEAIGINEKFYFINELFDGVMKEYNEAIETLNSFSSQDTALNYLDKQKEERDWKEESEALAQLKEILGRKFNY